MASIVDDPSSWTSKPKDIFGDKVKDSLDQRGWGKVDGTSPGDPSAMHSLTDYQSLRSALDTVRSYMRNQARKADTRGESQSAKHMRDIAEFAHNTLESHPKDGGHY
jgi:hypothetical protein